MVTTSTVDEEFASSPFRSAHPMWAEVAEYLGYRSTASTLGGIPELQGLAEYMYAKEQSQHTRHHIGNNAPFSDLVFSESDDMYSFGAKNIGFVTTENFHRFCRTGGFDPSTMEKERRMKAISKGFGMALLNVYVFYSPDKTVAFTCNYDPRTTERASPGRYLEVAGLRKPVKAMEMWLRKSGVGKNLFECGLWDEFCNDEPGGLALLKLKL